MQQPQTTVPALVEELDLPEYFVLNTVGRHTDEYPFCQDPECLCRENCHALAEVVFAINDGLITVEEGNRYYHGQTI